MQKKQNTIFLAFIKTPWKVDIYMFTFSVYTRNGDTYEKIDGISVLSDIYIITPLGRGVNLFKSPPHRKSCGGFFMPFVLQDAAGIMIFKSKTEYFTNNAVKNIHFGES